jgi:hypothetical protein
MIERFSTMNGSEPAERNNPSVPPPGGDNAGALVLGLLAIAAFCGWYILVRERPNDTDALPVIQKPLIPPTATDTSSDLPGHTHYSLFGAKDQSGAPRQQP